MCTEPINISDNLIKGSLITPKLECLKNSKKNMLKEIKVFIKIFQVFVHSVIICVFIFKDDTKNNVSPTSEIVDIGMMVLQPKTPKQNVVEKVIKCLL